MVAKSHGLFCCHNSNLFWVFQLGFETSESYIAPRPVYTVALSDGECALATPPYASPEHTHIIHTHIDNLLTLAEARDPPLFWRGDTLRDYRFDKNIHSGIHFPMTMPRLTMGGGIDHAAYLTVDDSAFIHFLAQRGVRDVPVAVRVLDGGYIAHATSLLNAARAPLLDHLLRARTDRDVTGTDFTTFMPIDELVTYVNGNIDASRDRLRVYWDGNEQSEYREFMAASGLIDRMMAQGIPGAMVKKPRGVFSVTEGMRDMLGQGDMAPVNDLPAMEWVDRFERLYERHMFYTDQAAHHARDMPALHAHVDALATPMAQAITASPETMAIAHAQLSTLAYAYLQTRAKAPAPEHVPSAPAYAIA